MNTVITGASGNLGRSVAELMLERDDAGSIVLVTRDPGKLSAFAARGATVRAGDFDRPDLLRSAFADADRLLLISTDALGRRVRQHAAAIAAAKAAGVGHVVYTSLPNPSPANASLAASEHRATEEMLRASGLRWTVLRNALYSEHRIPEGAAALRSGSFQHNFGTGRSAFVSREDCAAAAAAVLAGVEAHAGVVYDITGPELLGASDLAALYGHAGSVTVPSVGVDDSQMVKIMRAAGLPSEVAALLTSFGTAIRDGQLNQLTTAVADLTGREPRTVASVVGPALSATESDLPGRRPEGVSA